MVVFVDGGRVCLREGRHRLDEAGEDLRHVQAVHLARARIERRYRVPLPRYPPLELVAQGFERVVHFFKLYVLVGHVADAAEKPLPRILGRVAGEARGDGAEEGGGRRRARRLEEGPRLHRREAEAQGMGERGQGEARERLAEKGAGAGQGAEQRGQDHGQEDLRHIAEAREDGIPGPEKAAEGEEEA